MVHTGGYWNLRYGVAHPSGQNRRKSSRKSVIWTIWHCIL